MKAPRDPGVINPDASVVSAMGPDSATGSGGDGDAQSGRRPLSDLFLFEALNAEQLAWLEKRGSRQECGRGWVYREGDPAESLFVLLRGELTLTKSVSGEDVDVLHSAEPGSYGGAIQAYLDGPAGRTYTSSMRADADCRFFVLPAAVFAQMMRDWFPTAVHLLQGLFYGSQSTHQAVTQREHLAALGSLAAGLTHELNNPAAAAVRATALLRNRLWRPREELLALLRAGAAPADIAAAFEVHELALRLAAAPPTLTPLEAADQHDQLVSWFENHQVEDGWDLASTFVQVGCDADFLEHALASSGALPAGATLRFLSYTVESELLVREIEESTRRISAVLAQTRPYTHLENAAASVDINALLEATLLLFTAPLSTVSVVRDYEAALPPVPGNPIQLNQLWTNLIQNALDAMSGHGTLTLRTRKHDAASVTVEIRDTGPGVPEGIRGRIFDPFFTTKAFGRGLGLDVARRVITAHRGELQCTSSASGAVFAVRLPVAKNPSADESGPAT